MPLGSRGVFGLNAVKQQAKRSVSTRKTIENANANYDNRFVYTRACTLGKAT